MQETLIVTGPFSKLKYPDRAIFEGACAELGIESVKQGGMNLNIKTGEEYSSESFDGFSVIIRDTVDLLGAFSKASTIADAIQSPVLFEFNRIELLVQQKMSFDDYFKLFVAKVGTITPGDGRHPDLSLTKEPQIVTRYDVMAVLAIVERTEQPLIVRSETAAYLIEPHKWTVASIAEKFPWSSFPPSEKK